MALRVLVGCKRVIDYAVRVSIQKYFHSSDRNYSFKYIIFFSIFHYVYLVSNYSLIVKTFKYLHAYLTIEVLNH